MERYFYEENGFITRYPNDGPFRRVSPVRHPIRHSHRQELGINRQVGVFNPLQDIAEPELDLDQQTFLRHRHLQDPDI